MASITWLHLSDWHQRGSDFDRKVVRDALLRDIRERRSIDPRLAEIAFVVFSGDLAHGGKEAEYKAASEHLLDPVLKETDVPRERLLLVPGNHDLDRDGLELVPAALTKPLVSNEDAQKWLTDAKRRSLALEPWSQFSAFATTYTGHLSPAYANVVRFDAGGRTVALLGLNSAWMCGRHRDAAGRVDDYGHLVLGEPQIHDALSEIDDADIRIVVLHHPWEWLAEWDRQRVRERIQHAAHFVLMGHQHVGEVQVSHGTGGDCVVIPAGASYDRRVASDPTYANAYNWVHLDFTTGRGSIFLRRWSQRRHAWVDDIDAPTGGCYVFALPKNLGAATPAPSVVASLGMDTSEPPDECLHSVPTEGVEIQVVWDRASYRAGTDVCKALVTIRLDERVFASEESESRAARTPVHHLLALDVSGSMNQPDKYPVLVEALDLYLASLADDDLVTLVPFSTVSEVLVGAQPVGDLRARHPSVRGLLSSWPYKFGGTNMNPGLAHALANLANARGQGFVGVERMSCLTDGRLEDYVDCHITARQIRGLGVGMSIFGFGADFDAAGAEALAIEADGSVRYVPAGGHELREYFGHMARASQRIALQSAELSIEVAPNVTCFHVFMCRPHERHVGNFANISSPVVTHRFGTMEYRKTYVLLAEIRAWQAVPEVGTLHFRALGSNKQVNVARPLRPSFGAHAAPVDSLVQMMAASVGTLVNNDRETQTAALEARIELYQREGRPPQHVASLERQLDVLRRGGSMADLSADDRNFATADAGTRRTTRLTVEESAAVPAPAPPRTPPDHPSGGAPRYMSSKRPGKPRS